MDVKLVKAAKHGDGEAFVLLMREMTPKMRCLAEVIVRNEAAAQDCVSETVLQAYRQLARLKWDRYFQTWVTRICLNLCKREYNRQKRIVALEQLPDPAWRDVYDLAECYLYPLSKQEAQIVLWHLLEERSFAEIADGLGQSASAVKSRYYRSLRRLREELTEE